MCCGLLCWGDAIAELSRWQSTSRLQVGSVGQGLHHFQGSGVFPISHLYGWWGENFSPVPVAELYGDNKDVWNTEERLLCSSLLGSGHITTWPRMGNGWETVVCHILPIAFQSCLLQSCFQSAPLKKQPSCRGLQYCLADVDFAKTHWHIHIVLAGGVFVWINITTHDVESSYCGNEACFLITVCGEIVRNAWLCSVDRVWYIIHLYICN